MRLNSLSLGFVSLAALVAHASDLPVPQGAQSLEYKKSGNTYTWKPVGSSTPPGSGSISFPSTQTISTVEPKITSVGALPYQNKVGASAKVSISTGINKQGLAKFASDSVKGVAAAASVASGSPYVTLGVIACGIFCDPLIQWGVDQLKVNPDGSVSALTTDPSQKIETSDGYQYKLNGSSSFKKWYPSKEAACLGGWSEIKSYGYDSVISITPSCQIAYWGTSKWGPFSYQTSPSSCPAGSTIVNGVCDGEPARVETSLDDFFEQNISSKPWNADFASIAAKTIAMGILRNGNLFTDDVSIAGPGSVPIGETVGTWPVNVLPGTTTPVTPGYIGETEPGTMTTTSTTTANNTFRPGSSGSPASMTTTQTTITTTSVTNNITNITNVVDSKTETKDDTPPDNATDIPFADLPELYKQKYPDGLIGVLRTQTAAMKATPLFQLPVQLMGDLPQTGQCPSWQLDLSLATWASFGTYNVGADCAIWDFAGWVIVISAFLLARQLIFGG